MIFRHWPPQYDPANPASLFYYFDAADTPTLKGAGGAAITDGAQVYEWLNKGTSSAKFSDPGVRQRPTYVASGIDGRPAIRCNGNSGLRLGTVAGLASMSGLTMFAVGSTPVDPGTGGNLVWTVYRSSLARNLVGIWTSAVAGRRLYADDLQSYPLPEMEPNKRFIITATFDFANARARVYHNGVLRIDEPFQSPGLSQDLEPSHVHFGANTFSLASPDAGKCDIEALGLVRSAPSPDEMVPLHHWLRIAKGIG